MEDRSALCNDIKSFSQRKLKPVETKVVTASGDLLVEKRGANGLQVLKCEHILDKDKDKVEPQKPAEPAKVVEPEKAAAPEDAPAPEPVEPEEPAEPEESA